MLNNLAAQASDESSTSEIPRSSRGESVLKWVTLIGLLLVVLESGYILWDTISRHRLEEALIRSGETCVAYGNFDIVQHWKPTPYDYIYDGKHHTGATCAVEDVPPSAVGLLVGQLGHSTSKVFPVKPGEK